MSFAVDGLTDNIFLIAPLLINWISTYAKRIYRTRADRKNVRHRGRVRGEKMRLRRALRNSIKMDRHVLAAPAIFPAVGVTARFTDRKAHLDRHVALSRYAGGARHIARYLLEGNT